MFSKYTLDGTAPRETHSPKAKHSSLRKLSLILHPLVAGGRHQIEEMTSRFMAPCSVQYTEVSDPATKHLLQFPATWNCELEFYDLV